MVARRAIPSPPKTPPPSDLVVATGAIPSPAPEELLRAKTTPPPLPVGYLPRPRLDQRWRDWESHRLVLITAPAGYGKTAVMAANADRSGRSVSWYACDPSDADGEALAARMATRSIESAQQGWNIIIDNAQLVGSFAFLESFLRSASSRCTLFVASREPVPFPASDLVARGAACKVGAQDLDFTPEEAAALFRARLPARRRPADDDLERIMARTEGWPAGLAFHLRDEPRRPESVVEPGWCSYFAEEVLPSLDPKLRGFVVRASVIPTLTSLVCDEVMQTKDAKAALEDLHRRGIFTCRVSSRAADTLRSAAIRGSEKDAERKDALSEDAYRFHPLFREFLERRLRSEVPEGEVRALRRRAARRFAREGLWAEAALAFATAGDPAAALRIVEKRGLSLLIAGEVDPLLRVFAALQPDDYDSRPHALLVLGRAYETEGRWAQADAVFTQALHLASGTGRHAAVLHMEVMTALPRIRIHLGQHEEAGRLCRKALESPMLTTPRSIGLRAWARFVLMLGGLLADAGRLDEAETQIRRVGARYEAAGDAAGIAQTTYLLAICVQHPRGELDVARDGVRRALEFFRGAQDAGVICHCDTALAALALEAGEESDARNLGEETLRRAARVGLRDVEGRCHWILGHCALLRSRRVAGLSPSPDGTDSRPGALGDLDFLDDREDAASHFAQALSLGERLRNADLRVYPRLGLAELALVERNARAAHDHAGAALEIARHAGARLGEAEALVLLGSWLDAEKLLRDIGAMWHLHRLLLLRLHSGDAPAPEVAALLEELIEGVTRMRHEAILLVHERDAGVAALGTALRRGIHRDVAARLLLRLGDDAVPELRKGLGEEKRTAALCARLLTRIGTSAALDALAPLRNPSTRLGRMAYRALNDSGPKPDVPLRIHALGKLEIEMGSRVITPPAWGSARVTEVFVALLLHRFRWVSKDEMLEAVWPGDTTGPAEARHGLRQALYVLRRSFQPDLGKRQPSAYLPWRGNMIRLEPGIGSSCDIAQFEEGLAEARKLLPSTRGEGPGGEDASEAIRTLRRTLALYKGDLVEDLPCVEFVIRERARLRDAWIRASRALLRLLDREGAWEELIALAREAISRDPLEEGFAYRLVRALRESGRSGAAREAYQAYMSAIREEDPGAQPTDRMRDLRKSIRARWS